MVMRSTPVRAKDRMEAGPSRAASLPGKRKMLEPMMALMPMQVTSKSVSGRPAAVAGAGVAEAVAVAMVLEPQPAAQGDEVLVVLAALRVALPASAHLDDAELDGGAEGRG